MQETTEKQLNSHFSEVPFEFFGKDGAARFTNRGKRFTASKIWSAALLLTRKTVLGDGCTTSYADFENELRFARATTARNVAELTRDGAFKRNGQSKYETAYFVDNKHGVPVYHFLRTETFNGKRLSGNAGLYLSLLIQFYMNKEREQKYFIGGEKRAAKAINVPQSTAHGIIDELLYAGVMRRFMLHDGKLHAGKGINADYLTVYVVDDKILNTVKAIRKQINKAQERKAELRNLFAPSALKTSESNVAPAMMRAPTTFETRLSEQVNNDKSAATLAELFKNDFAFNQLKREYKTAQDKLFTAFRLSGGSDTSETQELEHKLDVILSDVLNFLLSHNVRREELPDDWKQFVRLIFRS